MDNSYHIIKCPHCKQIFFGHSEQTHCICCKQSLHDFQDIFGDLFGNQNNPFQDFTNQGE